MSDVQYGVTIVGDKELMCEDWDTVQNVINDLEPGKHRIFIDEYEVA